MVCLQDSPSRTSLLILLCFAISPGGIIGSASAANPTDLSTKYDGIIKGLANGFATFGGAFNPVLVGYLLSDGHCPSDGQFKLNRTIALKMASRPSCKRAWDTALNIAACICVVGCIVFLSFGSGKEIRLDEGDMEGDDVSGKRHTHVPLETPIG